MASQILQHGAQATLTESNDSPTWTFGDKVCLCTRTFTATYAVCLAAALARGSRPVSGTLATYYGSAYLFVEQSTVQRSPAGLAKLTVQYSLYLDANGNTQDEPADSIFIETQKIEIPLERHERYRDQFTEAKLDAVHNLLATTDDTIRTTYSWVYDSGKPEYTPLLAEFYLKLKRGLTHYPLYVPVVKRRRYFLSLPSGLTIGGFRETPVIPGLELPTADWMREGDSVEWDGRHWVVTSSWLGGDDLDADIYP